MIARAAFICRHSFAQFRTALISITMGNLYGVADHTTPIYEDYARGALKDWEIVLRKTIKRVLRLPKGYPNDLLHKVTDIPSIATLLNKKIVERLLRLHKGLEYTTDPEERRLIQRNIETMSKKQILQLQLTADYSLSELKLKKREMEANFWTNIDARLPNFPHRKLEINRYGDTDSILSRSLTAKEIYNHLHLPNQHLPQSLKCKICQEPLTPLHTCLYQTQPTPQIKAKIAELYYNWEQLHSTPLKEAVNGTTLHNIARMMNTAEEIRMTANDRRTTADDRRTPTDDRRVTAEQNEASIMS